MKLPKIDEMTWERYYARYAKKMGVAHTSYTIVNLAGHSATLKLLLNTLDANGKKTVSQLVASGLLGIGRNTFFGITANVLSGAGTLYSGYYFGKLFGCLVFATYDYFHYEAARYHYRGHILPEKSIFNLMLNEIEELLQAIGFTDPKLSAVQVNKLIKQLKLLMN